MATNPTKYPVNVSNNLKPQKALIFDDAYLKRLRSGDPETVRHFDFYFRRLVKIKIWRKFDPQAEDELVNDVMSAAIEKILKGEPRDSTNLPAYICGICSNLTKSRFRPRLCVETLPAGIEQIGDQKMTAEGRLVQEETAKKVRGVLAGLRKRDHDILVDLFFAELSREEICAKYGVTRDQLKMALFRARRRFQREWKD